MIFILLFLFGLGGFTSMIGICSIRGTEITVMNSNLQHVIISTHAIAVHLSLLVNNSKMNNIIVIEKQI